MKIHRVINNNIVVILDKKGKSRDIISNKTCDRTCIRQRYSSFDSCRYGYGTVRRKIF